MARIVLIPALAAAAALLAQPSPARAEAPIIVSGWPLPLLTGDAPDMELGDDPVVGRQACPALTRLNLATKKSEDLLLRRVAEEFRDAQRGASWRFELRNGLFWWSGEPVTSTDLAEFLTTRLPAIVADRGSGLWEMPQHKITADGADSVTIAWTKPPVFGPYILSGAPFFRASKAGSKYKFECAGLYRIEPRPFGIALTPTPGYKSRKPLAEVHLYNSSRGSDGEPPARSVGFRFASEFGGTPWTRISDDVAPCKVMLELPYATMIAWNTTRGPVADPRFRALMTQLLPRGALLRSAAASLGELVSAPIPRAHPGYSADVVVRPFDLDAVSRGLGELGYRRKTAETPRLDAAGQPLRLVLRAAPESAGLPEKVIADAFAAVGISVTYVDPTASDAHNVDGSLAAMSLDWPRVSFLGSFHSGMPAAAPFWPLADRELDRELESYATSLTTAQPAFATLSDIHRRLYALEPASIVLQHKVCADAGSAVHLAKPVIDPRDPDWFRQLVL